MILFSNNCLLSYENNNSGSQVDNIGIIISRSGFDSLVVKYLQKIKNNDELCIDEHIDLVRIYNTEYYEKDTLTLNYNNYKELMDLYDQNILKLACKVLQTKRWKGGCQYSSKYKIFIDGPPDDNSQFFILEE